MSDKPNSENYFWEDVECGFQQRRCSICKEVKNLQEFPLRRNRQGKSRRFSYCRICNIEICRKWREKNPERVKHHNSWEKKKKYHLKNRWGISIAEYDAMLKKQNGGCAICGRTYSTSYHGNLSVDHCHKTGKIRGLLCQWCNIGIGNLRESVEILEAAIRYLKQFPPTERR